METVSTNNCLELIFQVENVRHSGRQNNLLFFTGVTNLIFTFGGHNITMWVYLLLEDKTWMSYKCLPHCPKISFQGTSLNNLGLRSRWPFRLCISVQSWLILAVIDFDSEIMDAMKRPSRFKYVYLAVVGYTLAVATPSGISVYWAYGDILLNRANAFSVVPKSRWRTAAIALMVSHQVRTIIPNLFLDSFQ